MAMSRSLQGGSDEIREQTVDICCYCANNDKIQPATHFCFDCGVFGRYLCATCLRSHNLFVVGIHNVNHIGSQSNSRSEKKDEQLLKLERTIRELKAQNNIAVAEKEDRLKLVMKLEHQLEESNSENAELESQNAALLNTNKDIAAEKSKCERELKAVIKDKDQQIKNVHTALEKAYTDFQRKKDELKEVCDREIRTVNILLSDVMKERDDLKTRSEKKDEQLLKLEGNIRELKAQNNIAVAEKEDRLKLVMTLEHQLEESSSENAELESQNAALLNTNKDIAAEKSKCERELKAVIKDKDQQIQNVHTALEKAYKDFQMKKDELKEVCDREIRTVNILLSDVMKERDDLKTRSEKKDEQLLKLEGNIRELKAQNNIAVAEKEDRLKLVMKLDHQLEESNSVNAELESQNAALLNTNKDIAAEKSKCERELKAVIKDKDQQIKNVHTALEKAYKDFQRKKDELKEVCDREIRTVNILLSDVMKERDDLKTRIKKKDERLNKLDGDSKLLTAENKTVKDNWDKAVAEKEERQWLLTDLEYHLKKSLSENIELQSKNEELLNEKKNIQAEKSNIEKELKAVIKDKDQHIKNGHIRLEKAYNDFKRKQDELKEACDRDIRTINNQLSDVMKERDDLKTRESMQHKNDFKLVASIDIGTTHSGYAYSFKHDYQADPSKVSTNLNWVAGSMALVSLKAPTAVLFDENQQFHSFGYEAENTYSELALDGEHHNWYFFKRFKMRLHYKKVAWVTEIYDDNGRKAMNIIDVFGAVINYLKERLLEQLKHNATEVQNQNIHWVLTVPAIWSDSAKQFMRESAYKAGIDDRRLSIASEPEAASLFCQMLPSEKIKGTEGARFDVASPGTKHMVIDLGGGTVDITVLERQADGDLKQLHKASGGAWGGTKVDDEFYQLLIRIIGGPLYQKFIDENITDHLDLQRELETKKRTINPQSSGKITLKVPVALLKMYEDDTEETVKEAIEATPYTGKITCSSDKMRIDAQVFKNLFRPCTDRIVSYIKDLLKQPDFQGTNIFVMVGGFSESVIIQDAIMKALPMGKVIIPAEAELAVLKGAVIFGHRALAISSGATGAKW